MKNVADIYPLTPTQAGILYHGLRSADPELYFEQVRFDLTGPVDGDVLRRALDIVVQRHPMLRTQFLWEGVPEPVQVVREIVEVPWEVHDWRSVERSDDDRAADLDALAADIRADGMVFDHAPLLRVVLVQLPGPRFHLLWNSHHLLLDGWSSAQVFDEWAIAYHALASGNTPMLQSSPPFKAFVAWRRQQDVDACRSYWTEALAGFTRPTPVPALDGPRSTARGHAQFVVEAATTAALRSLAQRQRTTLNTVLLAAWGVVLGRYHGTDDVVAGATLSGRPPELAGVESIVGMFVTTLPLRLRPRPDRVFADWLGEVQSDQSALREFQHASPAEIAGWSELPGSEQLFNSTFVFENYPIADGDERRSVEFNVTGTFDQSHFDLDVLIMPGDTIRFAASHDAMRLPKARVDHVLAHLHRVLVAIASDPHRRIDQLVLADVDEAPAISQWSTGGMLPDPVASAVAHVKREPIDASILADPARLVRHLAKAKATVVVIPHDALERLFTRFDDLGLRLQHARTWFITGTEPNAQTVSAFARRLPDRELFIPYDLENGARLGWHHHRADEPVNSVALVPSPHAGVRLLDDDGRLAPTNAIATIWAGGSDLGATSDSAVAVGGPKQGAREVGFGRWIGDGRIEILPVDVEAPADQPSDRPTTAETTDEELVAIEAEVLLLLRESLGRVDIGLDDDFFAMGGQSIVAVSLFSKLQQRFESNLALSVLFDAATARQLAAIIGGAETTASASPQTAASARYASRPWLYLVEIAAGVPDVQPLVFVHGAGGNVLTYRALSARIGADRPFYGLQASGIDGIQPPHESIDDMVEAYLDELRSLFPDGPYVLGGYSGGGVIAYEMASRLRAAGERVDRLMLIDTIHPSIPAQRLSRSEHLARALRQGPSYIKEKWTERTSRESRHSNSDEIVARLDAAGEVIPFEARDWQLTKNLFEIVAPYETPRYDGDVVMLKAEVNRDGWQHTTPDNGWAGLAPNLTVAIAPGDHDSLVVEPNVAVLARHIVDNL